MNNTQQNNPYEFMKFIPIQNEKHIGIAVIRYEGRFIFRFKIMPSDQGGYWAMTASFKTGTIAGKDKYEPAFSLDSEYQKNQLTDFVLSNVERELSQKPQPTSIFSNQQAQVPNQQQFAKPYVAPQQNMNLQQNGHAQANNMQNEYIPF